MKRIESLHHLMSSRPVPKTTLVIKTSGELRHRHGKENYLQAIAVSQSHQSSILISVQPASASPALWPPAEGLQKKVRPAPHECAASRCRCCENHVGARLARSAIAPPQV